MSDAGTSGGERGGAGARWLEDLLAHAAEARASDLHLMTGERPWIRLDGALVEVKEIGRLDAASMDAALHHIMEPSRRTELREHGEVDLAFSDREGRRARVSAFREDGGYAIAFRLLGGRPPSLGDLEMPQDLYRAIYAPGGLVLFAGQAGAGKTTTLAAVLQELVTRRAVRLITLEDPIEYRLAPGRALVEQRAIGLHAASFEEGVREAIDAGPDALAVGELRDVETIRYALEAAETGTLVFGTVHAADTMRAIGRMIDAFPTAERHAARVSLAATLRLVVSQALLLRRVGTGRVPAVEVCHGGTSLGALIREGKDHEIPSLIETSGGTGMRTMDGSLVDLVRRAVIKAQDAIDAAIRPDTVRRLVSP